MCLSSFSSSGRSVKMSCNGCRVLRKGCSDACILRPCLQWIESPEAQGFATVFVAKFFGRAGLMGFISAVPEDQRPALFQSLLYEACGRTVHPVSGAVGLLWTGNWNLCQAAVETVLKGEALQPEGSLLPLGSKSTQPTLPGCSQLASSVQESKLFMASEMSTAFAGPGNIAVPCSTRCRDVILGAKLPLAGSHGRRLDTGNTDCCLQGKPQLKRCRISEKERSEVGVDSVSQERPPATMMLKYSEKHPHGLPAINDTRETPESTGKLVAPVPRRLQPQEDKLNSGFRSLTEASREEMVSDSSEIIKLDLALSSNLFTSPRSGMKPGPIRVSSPSTISANSQGSVTSLGRTELSIRAWSSRTPKEECKLLNLLL